MALKKKILKVTIEETVETDARCSPFLWQAFHCFAPLKFPGWSARRAAGRMRKMPSYPNPDVTKVCKMTCLAGLVYALSGPLCRNRHSFELFWNLWNE